MPRPKPEPEDEPVRITISLPRKVRELAETYRALHPEENIRDFSSLAATALIYYVYRKHPDLLAEIVRDIRDQALAVAETASPLKKKPQPTATPKPGKPR